MNPLAYLSCQAVFKCVHNLGAKIGWQVVMFLNLMLFYKRLVVLTLTKIFSNVLLSTCIEVSRSLADVYTLAILRTEVTAKFI